MVVVWNLALSKMLGSQPNAAVVKGFGYPTLQRALQVGIQIIPFEISGYERVLSLFLKIVYRFLIRCGSRKELLWRGTKSALQTYS